MASRYAPRYSVDDVHRFIFDVPGDKEVSDDEQVSGDEGDQVLVNEVMIRIILTIPHHQQVHRLQVGVGVGVAVDGAVVGEGGEGGEGAEVVRIDQNNHKRLILVQRGQSTRS